MTPFPRRDGLQHTQYPYFPLSAQCSEPDRGRRPGSIAREQTTPPVLRSGGWFACVCPSAF